jgi:hypothetical protein
MAFRSPGFPRFDDMGGQPIDVSYDGRAFKLNGSHALFLSGSIHPTRFMAGDFDAVLDQAVANGLNMVTIYPFWNFNERTEGDVSFAGRGNYSDFVRRAAERGLFVWLRAGPFVCGEWTSGGLPVWLQQTPGFLFRTNTTVFTSAITKWMRQLVIELRPWFASQGGNILLVQVENELVEQGFYNATSNSGGDGPYTQFCGALAAEMQALGADVPWGMLPPTVDSSVLEFCSGGASCCRSGGLHGRVMQTSPCTFAENEQGFQNWGDSVQRAAWIWGVPIRSSATSMVEFVASGGSLHSWYMWAGGSHFGPWGAMGMTTAYATAGLLCPDALPNQPNFAHAQQLHATLEAAAQVLLEGWDGSQLHPHAFPANISMSNGEPGPAATVWRTHYALDSSSVTFLYNNISGYSLLGNSTTLVYGNTTLVIPSNSITILINRQPRANTATLLGPPPQKRVYAPAGGLQLRWSVWQEPTAATATGTLAFRQAEEPEEHLQLTKGVTEFALYTTSLTSMTSQRLQNGSRLSFVGSCGMGYVVFVDGMQAADHVNMGGTGGCDDGHFINTVSLAFNGSGPRQGSPTAQQLTIVAESLGLPTNVPRTGCRRTFGNVTVLDGDRAAPCLGTVKQVLNNWNMSAGLAGETMQIYSEVQHTSVAWTPWVAPTNKQEMEPGLRWYSANFSTPPGLLGRRLDGANDGSAGTARASSGLFLNCTGLSRGQLYLNGEQLGRFFTAPAAYRNDGSGRPTQALYSLPTSLLWPAPHSNLLTLVDVVGARDLTLVHLVRSMLEDHPPSLHPTAQTWPPDEPSASMGEVADCKL